LSAFGFDEKDDHLDISPVSAISLAACLKINSFICAQLRPVFILDIDISSINFTLCTRTSSNKGTLFYVLNITLFQPIACKGWKAISKVQVIYYIVKGILT